MTISELNPKAQEKLLEEAKKGDKTKIQTIIENFRGLVRNMHNKRIRGKFDISLDDYEQECSMKIMECIDEVSKKNYWQLCSLIEISLERKTNDFIGKSKNYNKRNTPVEDIIYVCDKHNLSLESKFDDLIVSDMTAYDSYNTLIKNKLSKEEDKAFSAYIAGKSLDNYAKERGVKVESVKKNLRRAVSKIVNKKQIKEFHCISMVMFMFLQNIWEYVECINILMLLE